jgi:hypothetical protein
MARAQMLLPEFFPEPDAETSANQFEQTDGAIDFTKVEYTEMTEEAYQEFERLLLASEETVAGEPEEGEPEDEREWI